MTALDLRTLFKLTKTELELLRRRYSALVIDSSSPAVGMFAMFLSQREAATIASLDRYCSLDEHRAALDVHVRLGWGFPFADAPRWPEQPDLGGLIAVAEHSDAVLAQLRDRVELYAAGAALHSALEAVAVLSRGRRQRLAAATRELDDISLMGQHDTSARVSPPQPTKGIQ
ncbi:hypothetical protein ENSA5_07630 [Enhygromyxa salina]|uniref:Uncharacterized protein n=1 Tax=Enhygromyxa salina TaxID=215803 RepID=A0A2S9YH48_9BACT|nr:hypothetical protein [Enhygromyxa salina]PRQ04427.1 hypothetical protein ENSA5_07630 [Enhygromyxa salina]